MKVGVIGGGISGVSLALKLSLLKEQGKDIDITLLEASNRLGGTIDSVHKETPPGSLRICRRRSL